MKTKILAVMFTDIVGFTQRTATQTYAENAQLLRLHDKTVHPLLKRFGGRVVKEIGDAVLATFASPTQAVQAAMAIQDRLAEINIDRDQESQLHLRIAINVGEIRVERGDIFGEGVNVTSRIEAETPVDEIYVSGATYLTMNRTGIPMKFLGQRIFKGIAEPVTLFSLPRFAVLEDEERVMQTKSRAVLPYGGRQLDFVNAQRRRKRFVAGALAAVLLAVAGLGVGQLVQHLEIRKQRATLATAIDSDSWRPVAAGLASLQRNGVRIDEQADAALKALSETNGNGRACRALDLFDELFAVDPMRRDAVARLRMMHAFGLLKSGELAQADACLDPVAFASTGPDGRLLEIERLHLDALEALRTRSTKALRRALKRYESFLRVGSAPPEHLSLIAEIAADSYIHSKTRPIADSLVLEFLGEIAAPALAERVLMASTSGSARSWLVARLETISRDVQVDWPAIYAAQLNDRSCTARRTAVERLRQLGRLSVAGLLLREVGKRDRCTLTAAREAVADLVANGDLEVTASGPITPLLVASR